MAAYKIYILNARGVRGPGNDATCQTAEEARGLAQRMLPDKSSTAEIWSGTELVEVVSAATQADLNGLLKPWNK